MGSFNVTCAVSHLSIGVGDPAVFIPLKQGEYAFKEFGFQFDQAFVIYPGIRGTYDDYGRIILDLTNPSRYYAFHPDGATWLAIAAGADRNAGQLEGFTYTWVHGEVYDSMIKGLDSSERPPDPKEQITLSAFILGKLGFIEKGKTGLERYTRKFLHPAVSDWMVACDGQFSRVYCGFEEQQFVFDTNDLIRVWPQALDLSYFEGKRRFDVYIDQAMHSYKQEIERNDKILAGLAALPDVDSDEVNALRTRDIYYATHRLTREIGLPEEVITPVTDHLEELRTELADLGQFLLACSLTSTLITPSLAGPQFGDQKASFALADLIRQIASDNLQEYIRDTEEAGE